MGERRFPIMATHSEVAGCLRSIPWAMLTANEAQARDNHSQSLERLAERGGLDVTEAVAILEGRRWRKMDISEASERLRALVVEYESSASRAAAHDAAVALAAKREVIEELRRAYWDNRDTSWETEAQRLLEKYGPTSEAPTNGNG